jgi:hypothetical protein
LQEETGGTVLDRTQHDRLVALQEEGRLSDEVAAAHHQIRMRGNDAIHENEGTHSRAHRQLHGAWIVTTWVHDQIYPERRRPASFQRPAPPKAKSSPVDSGPPDEVQNELEALKARLSAVEGKQQKTPEVEQLKDRINELETKK